MVDNKVVNVTLLPGTYARPCGLCKVAFITTDSRRRYCSKKHRRKAANRRYYLKYLVGFDTRKAKIDHVVKQLREYLASSHDEQLHKSLPHQIKILDYPVVGVEVKVDEET
jgi:hypothetical protein